MVVKYHVLSFVKSLINYCSMNLESPSQKCPQIFFLLWVPKTRKYPIHEMLLAPRISSMGFPTCTVCVFWHDLTGFSYVNEYCTVYTITYHRNADLCKYSTSFIERVIRRFFTKNNFFCRFFCRFFFADYFKTDNRLQRTRLSPKQSGLTRFHCMFFCCC